MLVKNVKSDHVQVRLGAADGFVTIDAQEPQEYFLDQVVNVSGAMSEARGEKAAQPMTMPPLQVCDECLLLAQNQVGLRRDARLEGKSVSGEKMNTSIGGKFCSSWRELFG